MLRAPGQQIIAAGRAQRSGDTYIGFFLAYQPGISHRIK
jgi:hypothetical protein